MPTDKSSPAHTPRPMNSPRLNVDLSSPDFTMEKHSVLLNGHQTSISLERAFWHHIKVMAKAHKMSLNQFVTKIDHARTTNLSSALRVVVLTDLKQAKSQKY